MNDGSATFALDDTGTSVLDLSLVDSSILPDTSWTVQSDTLDSDQLPVCNSYEVNTAGEPAPQRFNFKKADLGSYSRAAGATYKVTQLMKKYTHLKLLS